MADAGVRVRGLSALARALRGFVPAVERDLGPAGQTTAGAAAATAVRTTPKVSGALAGSVTVEPGQGDTLAGVAYGEDYGGWVEYGGSRGRPYVPDGRYLGPAARGVAAQFEDEAETAIDGTIRRHSWPRESV